MHPSGAWGWWLLALLLAAGLALDTWWVRYRPLPAAPEPVPVQSGELDTRSLGRLQVASPDTHGALTLTLQGPPTNAAIRWSWIRPDGADGARLTGHLSQNVTTDPAHSSARGYVWFRQLGASPAPMVFPVREFKGQAGETALTGTVHLLSETHGLEVMLGFFRAHGVLTVMEPHLQWLQQRPVAALFWWAALAGWVVWLAWLCSRWWQATPGRRRWLWPALALVTAPLFFSMTWLTVLREGVHALTGVHLTAALPFGLVIGEVVHFGLFFALTLATTWLMPGRPQHIRLLELAALATATEFVQEYIPGRSLKLQDWGINLAGITCALLVLLAWQLLRRTGQSTSPADTKDVL